MADKVKSKKKSNGDAQYWDVNVHAPGVENVEGVVIANAGKSILLNTKRMGSSLRQKRSVPKDNLIFVRGSLAIGETAHVYFLSPVAPVMRKLRRVTMEEGVDKDTGFLTGADEKGISILVNPQYANVMTAKETVVDAPDGAKPAKKKSSSKK